MKKQVNTISEQSRKQYRRVRYACVVYSILFLSAIGFMMMQMQDSYVDIIQRYPILLTGFISCLYQGYLFFKMNHYLQASLITGEFCIILDICAEFCLLNFPAAIFLLFGSLQSFQRNQSNVITFIQEVKKQHLQKQVAGCFSAYAIMLFSIFWILNSFS